MDFNTLLDTLESVFARNYKQSVNILGAPGGGKTSLCYELAKRLNIPEDRVWVNHAPLADPVDFRGVPSTGEGVTRWNPPYDLHRFRQGTGKGLIIHDDMAQASVQVKNVLGNLLLARRIDEVELDDQVLQVCTGNRQQDRAGTTRNPSQVDNRLLHLELDTSLDVWCRWALAKGIDPLLVAFMRLRPALLHDFKPDRHANPTPRTWEMVGTSLDPAMPRAAYLEACAGLVGEGAAAEWVGARDLMGKMPSIDGIMMQPATAPIPSEAAILYAVATALSLRANATDFTRMMDYINRMPKEFAVLTVKEAFNRDKSIASSKGFLDWSIENQDMFK